MAKKNVVLSVAENLKSVKVNDSLQFRVNDGEVSMLMRIEQILPNKRGEEFPRLFVLKSAFSGTKKLCTEDQVVRIITKSEDNPADWE